MTPRFRLAGGKSDIITRVMNMKCHKAIITGLLTLSAVACGPKADDREGLGAGGGSEAARDSVPYADSLTYPGWDTMPYDTGTGAARQY